MYTEIVTIRSFVNLCHLTKSREAEKIVIRSAAKDLCPAPPRRKPRASSARRLVLVPKNASGTSSAGEGVTQPCTTGIRATAGRSGKITLNLRRSFMLTGRKLALSLAFGGLLLVAFGVGCDGFFVSPTLTTIAVSPASVSLAIGASTTLQVYGTYSDGSRNQVTSGVTWTVDPTGIATVTGTGNANVTGVATGSTTATASAQAITGTASITVAGNVTTITPNPTQGTATIGEAGVPFDFVASPGPPGYITTANGGTLTITPDDGDINCEVSTDGSGNPDEVCAAETGATGPYQITMSYVNENGVTITSSPVVTLNVAGQ
jgi:hypothetical protein